METCARGESQGPRLQHQRRFERCFFRPEGARDSHPPACSLGWGPELVLFTASEGANSDNTLVSGLQCSESQFGWLKPSSLVLC